MNVRAPQEISAEFLQVQDAYLQQALEADRPTRLWPIRVRDLFKLIMLRFPGA